MRDGRARPRRSSGFTLIELMIAVAILGIAVGASWGHLDELQRQTHRQAAREALVRALENELEGAVACADRACLTRWAAGARAPDTDSWSRAPIARQLSPGPSGTWRAAVSAQAIDGERRLGVQRLVWVPR